MEIGGKFPREAKSSEATSAKKCFVEATSDSPVEKGKGSDPPVPPCPTGRQRDSGALLMELPGCALERLPWACPLQSPRPHRQRADPSLIAEAGVPHCKGTAKSWPHQLAGSSPTAEPRGTPDEHDLP